MTVEEMMATLAKMSKEEREEVLGKLSKDKKNTYKVVDVIRLYWGLKPDRETRDEMGKAGFHWNQFEKYWYADATEEALAFAAKHNFEEAK